MKSLEPFTFDPKRCAQEVDELRRWLRRHPQLEERKQIQPFFQKRPHLSAFLASYRTNIIRFDRLAFQYPLFGDFTCDIAVGDSVKHTYCFVEFEDAGPNSLFVREGKKATRAWSPRFDHGYSQIIDWFYKLDDMRKSDDFAARFGARSISYKGILVLGRDQYLRPGEKERLEWRRNHVVVASQNVECVTFDELLNDLVGRLDTFSLATRVRG
jgi:hypothetical protein